MRTEDLIDALSRDARGPSLSVAARLGLFAAAGCAVAVALFLMILGPRADFQNAVATLWYPLKIALLAATAALAFPLVEALSRPGERGPWHWLYLIAGLLGAAVAADILMLGGSGAAKRMIGRNAVDCLIIIQIFALAPLVALLAAIRGAAPTDAAKAGAAAGLLSGAIGGLLYGLFCPDDSPLFVALWYTLAIGITTLAGAVAGRWVLRW